MAGLVVEAQVEASASFDLKQLADGWLRVQAQRRIEVGDQSSNGRGPSVEQGTESREPSWSAIGFILLARSAQQAGSGIDVELDVLLRMDHNHDEQLVPELYRQIGQLKVELDWLQKKSERFS